MKKSPIRFYAVLLAVSCLAQSVWAADAGKLAVVSGEVKINERVASVNDPIANTDVVTTSAGASAKLLFTDESVMDLGPSSSLKVSDYALGDGENRTGTFNLLYGKLRSVVSKQVGPQGKVQVKTRDAVMGVRGTEFVVDSPRPLANGQSTGSSSVMVVSGSVEVRPPNGGKPVMVSPGQMASMTQVQATGGATTSGGTAAAVTGGSTTTSDGAGSTSSTAVVTNVSSDTMKTTVDASKAKDSSFVDAVQIDTGTKAAPGSPGGGGTSGGGQPPAQAGNLTMNTMGAMLVQVVGNANAQAVNLPMGNFVPSVLQGPLNTLPPAVINVGNLVHLSVTIQ